MRPRFPISVAVVLLAPAALAACAQGSAARIDDGQTPDPDATVMSRYDAAPRVDGGDPDGDPDAAPPIDAAPPVDAAPPIDAGVADPDAACVVTIVHPLGNPDFDSGLGGGWVEQSSGGYAVILDENDPSLGGLPAHTTPKLAWLGGDVDLDDDLSQDVAIPTGTTSLVLRGRRWVTTNETGTVSFDTVRLTLRTTGGAMLESLGSFTNLDDTTGWTSFELHAAAPHAGDVVRLDLAAQNDFSDLTNFFFDTLELEATTCD